MAKQDHKNWRRIKSDEFITKLIDQLDDKEKAKLIKLEDGKELPTLYKNSLMKFVNKNNKLYLYKRKGIQHGN